MNFRWPAKPENNYRPWYDIVWRTIFCVPMLLFLGITFILLVIQTRQPKLCFEWLIETIESMTLVAGKP